MSKSKRKGNIDKRYKRKPVTYKLGHYLIVLDSEKTEKIYIEGLKDSLPEDFRKNIKIDIIQTRTKDMIKECEKKRNDNPNVSDVWIVFDRDEVPKFDSIIMEAINSGINVAWSNPCFEIWLHSYFGKLPSSNNSNQCIRKFKEIYKKHTGLLYAKNNSDLYKKLSDFGDEKKAIAIHKNKYKNYNDDGIVMPSKMSICSTMYLLVESLKQWYNNIIGIITLKVEIMRLIVIDENMSDQRVDRFLKKYFKTQSIHSSQKWIRKKLIKVNGNKTSAEYRLQVGDEMQVYLPDEVFKDEEIYIEKKKKRIQNRGKNKLDIIYEDADILIVNKEKGLLVHPAKGEYKEALSTYVQSYLYDSISQTFSPSSVTRLDFNTEGLVLFCKNYESLKKYNELVRNREIKKYYMTICEGNVQKAETIEGYIYKNDDNNKSKLRKQRYDGGKFVSCDIKPLQYKNGYTRLEVLLNTGRSHQIRASLASIGNPIVGDVKYGANIVGDINSQILIAHKLVLPDKTIEIEVNNLMKVWRSL